MLYLDSHGIAVDELPQHRHGENVNGSGDDSWNDAFGNLVTLPSNSTGSTYGYAIRNSGSWIEKAYRVYTEWSGSNAPHNALQPSRAVYIWHRTA